MRNIGTRAMLCDRTREWAALELDGELSEFERALMRAHLDRCDECREFAADVEEIAERLRSAPLEPLARPVSLPVPRRIAAFRHVQVAAAAAVVLAAAGLGGLYGTLQGGDGGGLADVVAVESAVPAFVAEDKLVRAVRLAYLKPRALPSLGKTKPALPVSI